MTLAPAITDQNLKVRNSQKQQQDVDLIIASLMGLIDCPISDELRERRLQVKCEVKEGVKRIIHVNNVLSSLCMKRKGKKKQYSRYTYTIGL